MQTSEFHFACFKYKHIIKQAECRELIYEVNEAQCVSKVNLGSS
jgi:hypothetical protein